MTILLTEIGDQRFASFPFSVPRGTYPKTLPSAALAFYLPLSLDLCCEYSSFVWLRSWGICTKGVSGRNNPTNALACCGFNRVVGVVLSEIARRFGDSSSRQLQEDAEQAEIELIKQFERSTRSKYVSDSTSQGTKQVVTIIMRADYDGLPHHTNRAGYCVSDVTYGDHNARRSRVVTIGAGYAGILLPYKLAQSTQNVEHVIYKKNGDVGEIWLENRYPNCACDVRKHR